ncbi:TIGR02757 family protein [Flagellimonas halotolerans]|uniref:TIGR02757 family protein n=1 Tax=Flagellimonas halotolerans TaxID=3112164 RepID=A0ABU6INH2_9FLAO|nr:MULTISPECIES: TIGR02757 family protein [unclassified Allomuricauda]MEC3964668.1 TIGR02757 family protein [Muricauda sp. SYSU M86414]MEC4264537.1 TIGR02757 family protein [Muricauda sp. SYSU M84420]
MTKTELKEFLDAKVLEYNHPKFLEDDPIQIPHLFTSKEDIEISAFLTATIAWGNRKSIINNASKLMELMGNTPYDFVINHTDDDLEELRPFVHRTFNGIDLVYFVNSLKYIYKNHGGLEAIFTEYQTKDSMQPAISKFKEVFFELPHQSRTQKHVSDPNKGSAAKRINMFLRWMVRDNDTGVDFGLWEKIDPGKLSCPLDVHSGNVARKLKLLKRKQNDAKALKELDINLRKLDATDPVKYDFALFGLGVFERF